MSDTKTLTLTEDQMSLLSDALRVIAEMGHICGLAETLGTDRDESALEADLEAIRDAVLSQQA